MSHLQTGAYNTLGRAWRAGIVLPEPEISPIPDGSIDVQWRHGTHLLAVNIPAEAGRGLSCYATSRGTDGDRVAGSFGPEFRLLFLEWLAG